MEYIFLQLFMETEMFWLIVFAMCSLSLCVSQNLVSNSQFEGPAVAPHTFLLNNATGWNGQFFQLWNIASAICQGQCIDLQAGVGQNGYIQQTIFLQGSGSCNLSFSQISVDTNYLSHVMEVYWNGQLRSTQVPNLTTSTFESFLVEGTYGNNSLKFQQIGDALVDTTGMLLDTIGLTCQFQATTPLIPASSQPNFIRYIVSIIFSLPSNHIVGVRFIYLFAEDLWFYVYDKQDYEGVVWIVFNTTATIELWKFMVFDQFLNWGSFSESLPTSEYQYEYYARKKFVQIEGTSSVLIKASFPFFIYVIPKNILVCVILYFLFSLLKKYKISQHLRKFYFIKTVLLQTLIQGNIVYFVYVSFGHMSTSFAFNFFDKMSLLFTILFFWVLLVFSFAFYVLVGHFLKQTAGYFIYYFYRCNSGYSALTAKNLVRNFLRGTVFYFLHQFYLEELVLLSVIEITLILFLISLEQTKQVFISKTFYCLELIYNFLFVLFNFSLYFGYVSSLVYFNDEMKYIALQFQCTFVYLLITVTILQVFFDLMPLNWLKSKTFLELLKKCRKLSKETYLIYQSQTNAIKNRN